MSYASGYGAGGDVIHTVCKPIRHHWFVVHRQDERLSTATLAFKPFLLAQGGIAS